MAPLVKGSAAYKKKDGTIHIEQDKKTVIWSPISAQSDEKTILIAVKDITNLQQTPESAAKVMLRIIQKPSDSNEALTYQFHFNSTLNPREEANSIKNILTSAISAIKSLDEGVPKPKISALPPKSNAVATASIPRSSNSSWFDDTQLKNNIELQQTLMKNDPNLHRTYMESRRTKPDNVSDSQFNSQFWSTRTSLLRAYAIEINQQRGSYNVLSTVKPRQVDGELKMNISVEQVQLIFNQHPLVKRVYDENVPKLNDMEFWSRFFLSRLFKKLKGERMVETDNCDAIFDKYLDANNNLSLRNKQHAMHIPHIIDLEGNEENQGGSKSGNRKDFTMRPGSSAKVPIIRTLNSLSEKIMAQVAPSDINPLDPIGMNEETYNSLALRDLQSVSEDHKIALNVKEQSRFFSGDKKSMSDEAALYAQKSPSEVLLAFQNELCPTVLGKNAANELDLSIVNSVLDEHDSEDDDEGQSHVSIKASFQDAEKQIFEGIKTRRSEFSNSESRSSLLGLSQRIFDRLSLTHATTIEFLQYFWIIFLSGDPERAGELAKLVETLERAVNRIEAVAEDAEKERQELISKQKQNIKDVYKTSGRKIQWNPNSVPGGAKVVKEMTQPTIRALEKAAREYKKAFALETV
ncbi:General transcription and DNA repair factor IIH subunit tcf-29 [Golovinomyces cichoracearum]|uniref:General transcription and DNA repair factor IIH subunit tcf-29 n=1 Tax=Golovinomyces cichoracearum TaxID=62708 RepID=A0A420HCD6_9PEZI|nr:General transcription and DNA repair factor IIH subunit tcf-29 [Golovinomyces cichoracearum]